jgi:transposase
VETVPTAVGCPDCGVVAAAHGRQASRLRDLPVAGRAAVLVWHKRVWRCHEPLCAS